MKKVIFTFFILYIPFTHCQVIDVETKLYDMFVFSGSSFLSGKEDLRYHPARNAFPPIYSVNLKMNYHDIYREWTPGNGNSKTNYQYDMGIETEFPLKIFKRNFGLNLNLKKQIHSSTYSTKYNEAEFSGKNWEIYSVRGSINWEDTTHRAGISIKYTAGNNNAGLKINRYPSVGTDEFMNKYFYGLLEPAFGKDIEFSFNTNEINYAIEYTRILSRNFNLGVNFYSETNQYDLGINYYGNVEKIEGWKNLNGFLKFNRYSFGITCEYRIKKFIFRSLTSYSVPDYKLNINQDNLLSKDNVNLEISNLSMGDCSGRGIASGAGISYTFNGNISADLSYTLIRNNYSGYLKASTPVLGFEILPIAHQFLDDFDLKMNNNLFSLDINHDVNGIVNYLISFSYLTSLNKVNYHYNLITEFGFGSNKENQNTVFTIDLYKISLDAEIKVSNGLAVNFLFDQYIPVIKGSGSTGKISGQSSPPSSSDKSNVNNWGGSIYGFSVVYNFN